MAILFSATRCPNEMTGFPNNEDRSKRNLTDADRPYDQIFVIFKLENLYGFYIWHKMEHKKSAGKIINLVRFMLLIYNIITTLLFLFRESLPGTKTSMSFNYSEP